MTKTISDCSTCDELIQLQEKLLKQNIDIHLECVKKQEVLRLEFLGISTDYKYLKRRLDIAYEDILTLKSKHGNLTQHYEVLLKNNIITEFLECANDHETLQLKFIEIKHQCNNIKTNLDASNENIKSLKLEHQDYCRQKNGFSKRSNTLHLKLVESINECERVKESLNAAHESILMLNSEHDGLTQRFRILFEVNMVKEFLEYAKYQDELKLKFMEKTNENECSKSCLDQTNNKITSLNSKLTEIREMLNRERLLIEKIYKERDSLDYLSEELCRLLLKYQRVTASSGMEQQCSTIYDALLKSTIVDKTSETSNPVVKSELKHDEKEIDCDDFEKNNNELTVMKEEKTDLNTLVNTEVELAFSEDCNHSKLSNSNELSTETSPNSIKNSDFLHRNEISTLRNPASHEFTQISHASQISVLESLDEYSDDCIPDYEEETMTTSNTEEIVPNVVVEKSQTKCVPNLGCEIFRRDNSNMCELKEHNCIACERLKLFKCNECNQMFSRRDALQLHVSQVHPPVENYYDCAYCDKRFMNQKASLEFHIFTKHSEKFNKPYKCTICSSSFVKKYLLNFHMAENHDSVETLGRSESIESSQESHAVQTSVLESSSAYSNDRIPDHGEETISTSNTKEVTSDSITNLRIKQLVTNLRCDIFCRDYSNLGELEKHKCIACERLKLFKCYDCGQMFSREDTMQSHACQVYDSDSDLYDCVYCDKQYYWRHRLIQHIYEKHSEIFDKPFKCTICSASFVNRYLLNIHIAKNHDSVEISGQYNCDACDRHFKTKWSLGCHKHSAHGKKRYACTKCDKVFNAPYRLKQHSVIHTPGKPLKCSTCGQRFRTHARRKAQEETFHSTRIPFFFCAYCNANYRSKNELSIHIHKRHFGSSEKSFKCSICDCKFADDSRRKRHEKLIHNRELLPYSCAHCDKRYGDKSYLSNHIHKWHMSGPIRPFKCTICDNNFTVESALKNHLSRVHCSGIRLKCSFCDKNFKHAEHKKRHELQAHPPAICFYCSHCGKHYANKEYLTRHVERFHASEAAKRRFECTICNETFASKSILKKHRSTHSEQNDISFSCAHCDKVYHHKNAITRHMLEIHLPRNKKFFKCTICNKSFANKRNLDRHQRVHVTERPYKCSMCDKHFKDNEAKQLHERSIHGDHADFICAYCDKKFRRKSGVYEHIRAIHFPRNEKRFKCNICKKAFPFKNYLRIHKQVHNSKRSYKCSKCDKCFLTFGGRWSHERVSHEGVCFQCQHCDKRYSTKARLITHIQNNHV